MWPKACSQYPAIQDMRNPISAFELTIGTVAVKRVLRLAQSINCKSPNCPYTLRTSSRSSRKLKTNPVRKFKEICKTHCNAAQLPLMHPADNHICKSQSQAPNVPPDLCPPPQQSLSHLLTPLQQVLHLLLQEFPRIW